MLAAYQRGLVRLHPGEAAQEVPLWPQLHMLSGPQTWEGGEAHESWRTPQPPPQHRAVTLSWQWGWWSLHRKNTGPRRDRIGSSCFQVSPHLQEVTDHLQSPRNFWPMKTDSADSQERPVDCESQGTSLPVYWRGLRSQWHWSQTLILCVRTTEGACEITNAYSSPWLSWVRSANRHF